MRSRRFFAFFPLVCLLVSVLVPLGNVSFAEGITPLNVAILPPVNTDKYADGAVIEKMQAKIFRHFRYPYYEVIEPDKFYRVISTLDFKVKNRNKPPYDKEVMQNFAQELAADIVVVAELVKVRSRIYQRIWLDGDRYEETYVVLNCYTYSAKDGKYDKTTVSARNFDTEGVFSGLDTVVPNLTDEMLAKIPYRTIIKEE